MHLPLQSRFKAVCGSVRELKFLTSVYKVLPMNVNNLKDAKSKLTSNLIPNMRVFIVVIWANTTIIN